MQILNGQTPTAKDRKIIKDMIKEVEACKARLQQMQDGISQTGLSLDIDCTYDGFWTITEGLETLKDRK
jgi:hypothetical protein